jgi:hypothetical protein
MLNDNIIQTPEELIVFLKENPLASFKISSEPKENYLDNFYILGVIKTNNYYFLVIRDLEFNDHNKRLYDSNDVLSDTLKKYNVLYYNDSFSPNTKIRYYVCFGMGVKHVSIVSKGNLETIITQIKQELT